jgi:Uncharacterized conserved protein, contains double-stranded beta-helix domain
MSIKVFRRAEGRPSEQRGSTFTGVVWADPVMPTTDNVTVNNVFFTPGARTFWHTHEFGQMLQVTGGRGWVCAEGEKAQELRPGDVVWIPPHVRHWHGAATDTYMLHLATSFGKSDWQEEVTEESYAGATR